MGNYGSDPIGRCITSHFDWHGGIVVSELWSCEQELLGLFKSLLAFLGPGPLVASSQQVVQWLQQGCQAREKLPVVMEQSQEGSEFLYILGLGCLANSLHLAGCGVQASCIYAMAQILHRITHEGTLGFVGSDVVLLESLQHLLQIL